MKRNARLAFNALKKIGAPVFERADDPSQFILSAEDRGADGRLFADNYRDEIREYVDGGGRVINAWGVRQDVRDILDRYGLMDEWINAGATGIYPK